MNKFAGLLMVLAFAVVLQAPQAHAETATTATTTAAHTATLLETIKALLAKLESLKAELSKLRGEVDVALKDGLTQGMSDSDIKAIQALLATDKEIYPAGMVTGYFGPMTTEAIKKFQEKNGLPVTGEIDAATKALLEAYRKEHVINQGEEGFMRAPGIMEKMHNNMCARMPGSSNAAFCRRNFHPMWEHGSTTMMHGNPHSNDMMDDDDDDSGSDDDDSHSASSH